MKITTAGELQKKFKSGLQLVGEDEYGNLEWMGTNRMWNMSEQEEQENLNAYYDEQNQ
jgi:hypothetical protein